MAAADREADRSPYQNPWPLSHQFLMQFMAPMVLKLVEQDDRPDAHPFGRVKGLHGQFGMYSRTLSYILSLSGGGLFQVSGDAVLSANYILAKLKNTMTIYFPLVAHGALLIEPTETESKKT